VNKFELSPAFLIGHKKIDSDHQALVKILNEMVDGFEAGDVELCQKKWHQFCTRLEQHFGDEITIMDDFDFAQTGHEAEHQEILDHIKAAGERDHSLDNWESCLFEMRSDLMSWILKKDLLFAEHLITIGYNES